MRKFYFSTSRFKLLVFAFVLFFTVKLVAQSNYTVGRIPFQVYTANANTLTTNDDRYSGIIPLTFDFNFFGNVYNQAVISTNGAIDFRVSQANLFSTWILQYIPNPSFAVKNAILGCFHDMNNSSGQGQITYSVIGAAPYRKFIVVFNNQPLYSCTTLRSSFQMVLYETLNFIDVQVINKSAACTSWNGGLALIGIHNESGTIGFTPPGRNTGVWAAVEEGWRFRRPFDSSVYNYTKCDDNADGNVTFNLAVAQNGINAANPSSVLFYETLADAQTAVNPLSNLNYVNTTAFAQSIYAFSEGTIYQVALKVIDCAVDFDLDSVPTGLEDLNSDGNLANDDTDQDGIANFLDNDDDGDIVLTQFEYVFAKDAATTSAYLDTDGDTILNYLDTDDDGDTILTINEDYDLNYNPGDDDTNANGTPDYLDSGVALGTTEFGGDTALRIYPNPASDRLTVENSSGRAIKEIQIYNLNGQLVKSIQQDKAIASHSISELTTGMYIVKIISEDKINSVKLIKK